MEKLTALQLFFAATNGVHSRQYLVDKNLKWIAMDESGDVFAFEKEPESDEGGEWVDWDGGETRYVGIIYHQVPGNSPQSGYAIKIDESFLDDYEIDGKIIKASDKYESEGDAF